MPLIPLEDTFADVLNKAQRGRKITDQRLASIAGVSAEDLASLKAGKPIIAALRRVARHLRLNPDAMEALAKQTWYPKIPIFPRGFSMFNTKSGDLSVNSYLAWDTRTKQAIAVDTGLDATDMIDFLRSEKLELQYILITHAHHDHIGGLAQLASETKALVCCSEKEPSPLPGTRQFKPDAYFHVATLSVKALLTSGHSPGLTTFFVNGLSWPIAFCGDALFAGSMGGSDEFFNEQYSNNKEKILKMPKDTVIAPGHGPLTTLAQELLHNPFYAY